ncbi:DMT family transporter [Bradyrhizobium cajani]|uniref:EamA family transporter n=1 Tax=Bradyrhizobium cajani TaxID=1928661 RepID=A0A844TEX3_9BRAD|nr:EamA family transporter [Bradyrhizobium cajani]MCP3368346.1 EamA family transporter [Bradyrhizobium cajani]MVT73170.1 EamA family transporter [Bradyrhizobium cajani]
MVHNLALFAVMSLIWGLTWAAIKVGLTELPPLLLAAARYLLAAALLALAVRGARVAFSEGRAARTIVSALLVNTGTYGLLFWGMQHVPSGLSGLVNLALIPVLLFGLAALSGEEQPTWRHAVVLAIGCAGLVGLFWTRLGVGSSASGVGLAAIVVGTASYCVGSVVARPLIGPVKPLALTMVQAAIGGAALLGLSLALEPISIYMLDAFLTPAAIGSLLFLALLGTMVAFTIYLVLLREWGTMRAGFYAFVSPIVALGAGVWFFGEAVGWVEAAGAALMLVAAAVTLLRPLEKSLG